MIATPCIMDVITRLRRLLGIKQHTHTLPVTVWQPLHQDQKCGPTCSTWQWIATTQIILLSVEHRHSVPMQVGQKNRSVGATLMNQESSRSHSIFTITIESHNRAPGAQVTL